MSAQLILGFDADAVVGGSRAVSGAGPAAVAEGAEVLRARGFINYFGLQRFGNGSSPTHRHGPGAGGDLLGPVAVPVVRPTGSTTLAVFMICSW